MYKKRCTRGRNSVGFSNRRGQVTVFIIIGLLLLVAVFLVIFMRQEIVTFKPGEFMPSEKGKVERFITACIDQLGNDALLRLGEQGGYVELPTEIAQNAFVHLRTSPFTVVPYWAHGEQVAIPSLPSIKEQIDKYIEEGLRECVFGLGAFERSYDLVEKSNIKANTEIVENKVLFNVEWNIEIKDKAGEVVTETINHIAESDIKLKRVYEAANRVIEREMTELKLEDITQDLIALEHPDVPTMGFDFGCSPKTWKVAEVKTALQDLLRINIGELKVKGTEIVEFPDSLPYYQNHYVWNLGEDFIEPEVNIQFRFNDNYPFNFDVNPKSGAYMKSSTFSSQNELLSFFCAQNWKFVYDLSFPVLVTVFDETTDYSFKIAFTVHLKHNMPDRSDSAIPKTFPTFSTYNDDQFCDTKNTPINVLSYELIDDGDFVYSRDVLEGVDVEFTCLKYSCPLGKTEYDFGGRGHVSGLQMNVPYCVGGIVRGKKDGYRDGWQRIVTEPGMDAEINLIPIQKITAENVRILKHELLGNNEFGIGQDLEREDIVIIKFTSDQVDEQTGQPLLDSTLIKSSKMESALSEEQKLEFLAKADYTYSLDISVLNGETLLGGYKTNWTVPWDSLQSAEDLTFHVVNKEKASEEEMFELFIGMEQNSRYLPKPEFS